MRAIVTGTGGATGGRACRPGRRTGWTTGLSMGRSAGRSTGRAGRAAAPDAAGCAAGRTPGRVPRQVVRRAVACAGAVESPKRTRVEAWRAAGMRVVVGIAKDCPTRVTMSPRPPGRNDPIRTTSFDSGEKSTASSPTSSSRAVSRYTDVMSRAATSTVMRASKARVPVRVPSDGPRMLRTASPTTTAGIAATIRRM